MSAALVKGALSLRMKSVVLAAHASSHSTHCPVDVTLDEEVEHGQHDVGQELPDLACQEHPKHVVLGLDADPAPAH